ncbi:MAG: flagellar hook-associated protein FlgK [Alphaproteobacteria bacterium]|nr:flagellar hook-associated protein FlgK [Alphaproteobacteria bacterium]
MAYQALNNAISGLRAAQQQLSVISNNISNATTPGYSRQILPQASEVIRQTGTPVGVRTDTIIRNVDLDLARDLWTQVSATSSYEIQTQYLQQIQNFYGTPDSEFNLAAQIADLRDAFTALSDIPDDSTQLQLTLNQAERVADKFNDTYDYLNQLRNDTVGDIDSTILEINSLLEQIAALNTDIRGSERFDRSTAPQEDQRDEKIKELSELIDISFFLRSDGVMVVQTVEGLELATEEPHTLSYDSQPVSADQYYDDAITGIFLNYTTNNNTTQTDITQRRLGGRLGGLVELRDDILPSYHAQLDELAFQLANRMDQQGLRLFTDQSGNIPTNTPPDPTTIPPTAVDYVGFSNVIQVNNRIVNDLSLLQMGTYNSEQTMPSGDNQVIRRVLEFAFGNTEYQEAVGTIDLNIVGPATDLQEWLGFQSQNRVIGGLDFSSFTEIDDGVAATDTDLFTSLESFFPAWPANAQFEMTFEEARGVGFGPATVNIDLGAASVNPLYAIGQPTIPAGGVINNALDQITSAINDQLILAGFTTAQGFATTNTYGQLVMESTGNIEFNATGFAGAMGADALNALGLSEGTFVTEDPSFTVQVGNNDPVTVTIEPGDTVVELIDKLEWDAATQTGVPGLHVDFDALTGNLTLRPGIDDTNGGPFYGGDISIISSGFQADPALAGNPQLQPPALNNTINVVSAIFGSFTDDGITTVENAPITDIAYQSETVNGSGVFVNFRNSNLGPDAAVSTGIFSATNLIDYAQKIVNKTSQDYNGAAAGFESEGTLRDIIQRDYTDMFGVNIDEELSHLIVVQTAYAASARAITAADEMMQELLNAFR